jgi:hypothetical protein
MAQFVTLMCFAGYVAMDKGWDQLDFRVAPMYQDARKAQTAAKDEEEEKRGEQ